MERSKKAKKTKFKGRDYDFDVNELFRIFAAAKELRDMIKTHKKLQPREFDAKLSKRQKKKMASEEFQREISGIREVMGEDVFGELAASKPHNSPAEFALDAISERYSSKQDFPIKIFPQKLDLIYADIPEAQEEGFVPAPCLDLRFDGPNNLLFADNYSGNMKPDIAAPRWEIHPEAIEVVEEKLSKKECEEMLTAFLADYSGSK